MTTPKKHLVVDAPVRLSDADAKKLVEKLVKEALDKKEGAKK